MSCSSFISNSVPTLELDVSVALGTHTFTSALSDFGISGADESDCASTTCSFQDVQMKHCANDGINDCKCAIGSKMYFGVSKLNPYPVFVKSMPITSTAKSKCGTSTFGKETSWYSKKFCYSCYCDSVRVATQNWCSGKTGDIGDDYFSCAVG